MGIRSLVSRGSRPRVGRTRLPRGASSRGIALIMTLLVLTILGLLIMQIAFSVNAAYTISENYHAELQNYYALRSGVALARLVLRDDDDSYDSYNEEWATVWKHDEAFEKSELLFLLEDEERRFNINILVNEDGVKDEVAYAQFERLVYELGMDGFDLPEKIVNYLDKDTDGRFEQDALNRRVITVKELLGIKDFPPSYLYGDPDESPPIGGLLEYITVAGSGKANVNTASREVLLCLEEEFEEAWVEAILQQRVTKHQDGTYGDFKSLQELGEFLRDEQKVPEEEVIAFGEHVDVKSAFFTYRGVAVHGVLESRVRVPLARSKEEGVSAGAWETEVFLIVEQEED